MSSPIKKMRVVRNGLPQSTFSELYFYILRMHWIKFIGLVTLSYISLNLIFALLYWMGGASIANVRIGSFFDAFVFSNQTFATIGYGYFLPQTDYAHVIVIIESIVGLTFGAIITGLIFAKFSRPTIHVVFSAKAIIANYDGVPTLMFRMGNGRDANIVDASVSVITLKKHVTKEGMEMQRLIDLKLERSRTPFFLLTWTIMHRIDESSPLYGLTEENIKNNFKDIFVTLVGYDEVYAQTVHASYQYSAQDIHFAKKFKDVITTHPDRTREINFQHFHEIEI